MKAGNPLVWLEELVGTPSVKLKELEQTFVTCIEGTQGNSSSSTKGICKNSSGWTREDYTNLHSASLVFQKDLMEIL
jgi:hypothetical protein